MPEETEIPIKPRRRWKRWLGIFLLALIGFGIWLNGPGCRTILKPLLIDQLGALNLTGDFEITGTLLTGLALEEVHLSGDALIQKLETKKTAITWSLGSLFAKHPEGIEISNLTLSMNLDAKEAPEEEEEAPAESEEEPTPLSETLDLVKDIIGPANISIKNLDIDILVAEKKLGLKLESLNHAPGSSTFIFRQLNLSDHLGRGATTPEASLTWGSETIELDQLEVLQGLGIRELVYEIEGGIQTAIMIADSRISASSDLAKDFELTLDSPALNIKDLASLYDPELPAEGSISELSVTPEKISLKGSNIRWEEQIVQSIDLTGGFQNKVITADLAVIYQDNAISLKASGKNGRDVFGNETVISLNYQDQLTAWGSIILDDEILQSKADLQFILTYPEIPEVTGTIGFSEQQVSLTGEALDGVTLEAGFNVESSTYTAKLTGNLENGTALHEMLDGPINLTANAKGDLPNNIHQGSLDLSKLALSKPEATATAKASWNWPEEVIIDHLQIDSPEGQAKAALSWKDDFLEVTTLQLIEGDSPILNAEGRLPAPLTIQSLDDVLANETPFEFTLESQPLSFERIRKFAPLPETLKGVFEADINLSGSLAKPQINGMLSVVDIHQTNRPKIPPADLRTTFRTENQDLYIDGTGRDSDGPLLDLNGKIAFLPAVWLKREKSPQNATIDLSLTTADLKLQRIKFLSPSIRSVVGSLKADLKVSGTLSKPAIFGDFKARIDQMTLAGLPVEDIRKSNLHLTFEDQTLRIQPSSLMIAGGTLNLGGKVDLGGEEPFFDISAIGKYFLLTRNADYTFRGHPTLTLKGPLSKASLSGTLEIAESLIYKNIEILPFGAPKTTDIPRPNLPTFTTLAPGDSSSSSSLAPAPFGDWPLSIKVTTADPILIRGNLARGQILVNAMIGGTIGNPRPTGSIVTQDVKLDLPFSTLEVTSGVVTLRPDAFDNPTISLRGSSKVSQYTVQVFLSGPVTNPTITLSSNPPLPEGEIMLLLATGSVASSLEDQDVASQKAMQFLFEGLRRRYGNNDNNIFERLLKNSGQIDISLGDANQFTGRKFSSATLELSDRWDFTTQIDDEGNTRAIVVFSVRFR